MCKYLHIVSGTGDVANGMVVAARLLSKEQGDAEVIDLGQGMHRIHEGEVEEVWVHGMWLPGMWVICWMALRAGKRLVRMTHGSLSPVYLTQQSPLRKKLVSPIERYFLRCADKVVATCEMEAEWIRTYLNRRCPPVEVTDLKRFFTLESQNTRNAWNVDEPLHLLYLGRRHPLKGVEYLEAAVNELSNSATHKLAISPRLKIVSTAFGDEKESVLSWCDILILPTLSDNFGLVVAEALERGKFVITTDGAPAWGDGNDYGGRLVYLRGYRDGTDAVRVRLLTEALSVCANH